MGLHSNEVNLSIKTIVIDFYIYYAVPIKGPHLIKDQPGTDFKIL